MDLEKKPLQKSLSTRNFNFFFKTSKFFKDEVLTQDLEKKTSKNPSFPKKRKTWINAEQQARKALLCSCLFNLPLGNLSS